MAHMRFINMSKWMLELRKLGLWVWVLSCLILLTACEEEEEDGDSYGYYQLVNLVPQSPDIEFLVDESSQGELGFSEATEFEYVSNTTYDLEFNQILPNSEEENFIDEESLKVSADTLHTYILYGETDAPSGYELELDVSDIYDSDYEDDYAIVQFVNLSKSDELVDVYLLDADDNLTNKTADYSLSLTDTSGDVEVTEGDYKIVFTESGSDTIIAQKNDISIDEAEAFAYILVSYDVAGSDESRFNIVELSEDGARMLSNEAADGHLRVANGVSNTYGVSIAIDDSADIVESSLALGEVSQEITIDISDSDSAESTDIYILNTEDESLLDSTTINIYADDQILLLSAGDTDSSVSLNDTEEDLRIIETHGKILFSHAVYAENDGSLDLLIIEQGSNPDSYDTDISVSYLNSVSYEIEAGDYDIYVYDDSGDLIMEHTLYDLQEGDVVNLISTDFESGGSPYQIYEYVN